MPTPKRIVLIVIRCIPVVIALGFLAFYVGRAHSGRDETLSSSKNARVLFSSNAPAPDNPPLTAASPPSSNTTTPPQSPTPPLSPTFSTSSETPPPTEVFTDTQTSFNPFLMAIDPGSRSTFGGSKSAIVVVEVPPFLRKPPPPALKLTSKITYDTLDLPLLEQLPRELIFGEPSIHIHADDTSQSSESPASTPPISSEPSPASTAPQPPSP